LRILYSDFDIHTEYRFPFYSPNSIQNRAPGVWTYRPNTRIREVAVYETPSLFPLQPRFNVEYDCFMQSNNWGLLQERDIDSNHSWTLILGDSFTAGEGGCPWFDRLQARRPDDHLVNAGFIGSGLAQWDLLLKYLCQRGLRIRRVLMIAIGNDFQRLPFNWPQPILDCLDRDSCPPADRDGMWTPVRMDETHAELEMRGRVRFSKRFGNMGRKDLMTLYIERNSYLYKFVSRARQTAKTLIRGARKPGGTRIPPSANAALDSLQALHVPFRVLMVSEKDEAGWLDKNSDSRAAEAALKAHRIPYSWCRIPRSGFMRNDMHPNRAGYDKLVACADAALGSLE
jgi:hypothetical protein